MNERAMGAALQALQGRVRSYAVMLAEALRAGQPAPATTLTEWCSGEMGQLRRVVRSLPAQAQAECLGLALRQIRQAEATLRRTFAASAASLNEAQDWAGSELDAIFVEGSEQ